MSDLQENDLSKISDDEDLDLDIFEFDRKLKEIVSKIDTTMQKINAHYPEQTENVPDNDEVTQNISGTERV